MNFKEYVGESDSLAKELTEFFNKVKSITLASAKVVGHRVSFKFPDYESLVGGAERPMSLVAHVLHEVGEDPMRHKKGWQAYKGLQAIGVDPEADWGWTKKQQKAFKEKMTVGVRKIAQPLGFLFEAEVFLYLKSKGMHDPDEGAMDVPRVRAELIKQIQNRMGSTIMPLLSQMLHAHVVDMGDQIETKTKELLGCADLVWFAGGVESSWEKRGSPADLYVGCSYTSGPQGNVGYSLKFGTETRIHLASMTPISTVKLLGGDPDILAGLRASPEDEPKEWTEELSDLFAAISENISPAKFTRILNYLLTGNKDVIPAPRNYASTQVGGVEWSGNMRKDFTITKDLSNPLNPKKGADVEVSATKSYMRMTYRVPGGSASGTAIYFIPSQGKINIKVTNLTSGRR